ncbi:hypothetical protein WJX82_007325 [Trebouxia sp. C0006]
MGSVEGLPIFTQLLGGETADYIGAVRVFGIGDKMLFEQLTSLDNREMTMSWQLTTHPMNSNPFPAAFVNCKASLQVLPVTLPSSQAFIQWRIDLLTELEHVTHMTKAIDDIMVVGLTNLIKYMEKSTSTSSGAHSSTSTSLGGIVGSSVAPATIGVQYMPQPAAVQPQGQPLPQGLQAIALSGDSSFLQQPTFVPAPGQSLAASAMTNTLYSGYQQQQPQQHSQYQQQQQWFQQQQQQQLPQQQQFQQYQPMPMTQQQLQQQFQQQLASQQAMRQSVSLNSSVSDSRRSVQRTASAGPQRGPPGSQPGANVGSAQVTKSTSQESLNHGPQ